MLNSVTFVQCNINVLCRAGIISLPTMAGEASMPSSSLFVASTSNLSPLRDHGRRAVAADKIHPAIGAHGRGVHVLHSFQPLRADTSDVPVLAFEAGQNSVVHFEEVQLAVVHQRATGHTGCLFRTSRRWNRVPVRSPDCAQSNCQQNAAFVTSGDVNQIAAAATGLGMALAVSPPHSQINLPSAKS